MTTTTRHHPLGLYLSHPSKPAIAPKGATTAIIDRTTITICGNGKTLAVVPSSGGYQIKKAKG